MAIFILARVARIYPVAILAMIVTATQYITFSTTQTVVLGNNGAPLLAFREPIGIFNSLVNLTFTINSGSAMSSLAATSLIGRSDSRSGIMSSSDC